MDDPVTAVASLRDATDVDRHDRTTELPADEWPDTLDDRVWVGAIVLGPSRDRVALVRTHWSGDQWVFPGGGVEPHDASLEAAVRREVDEETGLAATVEEPRLIEAQTYVHADDSTRSFNGWFVLFQATTEETTFSADPGENPDEIEAVQWFEDVPDTLFKHAEQLRPLLG